jgi:hypothetical protein
VNVPIDMVQETLRKVHHGRMYPEDFVRLLREARMTKLVDVVDGDTHVKISVW